MAVLGAPAGPPGARLPPAAAGAAHVDVLDLGLLVVLALQRLVERGEILHLVDMVHLLDPPLESPGQLLLARGRRARVGGADALGAEEL